MGSSSDKKCAVCERSFNVMLWKHTCDVCRHTVCDDCAPNNTESVGANGETTKLRVCKVCHTAGRRLGGSETVAEVQPCATIDTPNSAPPRADPSSEAERERRAAASEARSKFLQNRGRPQGGSAKPRVSPVLPASPASASTSSSPSPATTTTATNLPPPSTDTGSNAIHPVNPALEAALRRRQQQQQFRSGSAATAQATNASPEKLRLLHEIEALLAKHHEEPPFGLRASDEAKLRSYLQYVKTKYNAAV